MADDRQHSDDDIVHYEGGIPVFNTRLNELEKEAREAKDRDDEYKKKQLQLNSRLVWFTGVLAAVGIIGGAISAYQTHISGINAAAAQDNAAAAKGMVEEMKKSGNDTHELATQAGKQADRTRDLAEQAKKTGTDTHALAVAASKQADAAKRQSGDTELIAKVTQSQAATAVAVAGAAKSSAELSAQELELSERPWVDALMTIDGPFEFNVNGVNVHFKF